MICANGRILVLALAVVMGCGDDESTTGAYCGNGKCDPGEKTSTCSADCPSTCGNGKCDPNETVSSCAADCTLAYPQSILDVDLVWAIQNGIADIFNQNVTGTPVGPKNITGNCPVGGSVVITGTTSHPDSTGTTTIDLAYAMTGCKIAKTTTQGNTHVTVALTLDGTVMEKGSWNNNTGFLSKNYSSQSLTMAGTAERTGFLDAKVDQTCEIATSLTRKAGSTQGSTAGAICGRQVAWTWEE